MPGSLANTGFQDYSGLDTNAEADNSIPAASTTSRLLLSILSARASFRLGLIWDRRDRNAPWCMLVN